MGPAACASRTASSQSQQTGTWRKKEAVDFFERSPVAFGEGSAWDLAERRQSSASKATCTPARTVLTCAALRLLALATPPATLFGFFFFENGIGRKNASADWHSRTNVHIVKSRATACTELQHTKVGVSSSSEEQAMCRGACG